MPGLIDYFKTEIAPKLAKAARPEFHTVSFDLRLGDCSKVLETLPADCIDLTVTSPPYDRMREYKEGEKFGFEYEVFDVAAQHLYRITKPGGVVVWIVNDETVGGSETGTSFRQALHFQDLGFRLHDTMIWNKGRFVAIGALQNRYGPVFDFMFVLSKGKPKTFNPLRDRENRMFGKVLKPKVRKRNGEYVRGSSWGHVFADLGIRFNIWDVEPARGEFAKLHPAAFSEEIAEGHVLSWSNPGDIVLDPFAGSGTTGAVALRNRRPFIGIEKSKVYCDVARKRLLSATDGFPHLGVVDRSPLTRGNGKHP